MVTIEKSFYHYEDLCEEAKERAREWYAQTSDDDFQFRAETEVDFLVLAGSVLGISFVEKEAIYSADSWNRNRCFFVVKGIYEYRKGWKRKIRNEFGGETLEELEKIGMRLQNAQKRAFYAITGCLYVSNFRNYVQGVELDDTTEEIQEEITEGIRDFCAFCTSRMVAILEYIESEGYITDQIIANEYTFNEDGVRED